MTASTKKRTALIVGSTGIAGGSLALELVRNNWHVLGLARNPIAVPGLESLAADLLDLPKLEKALAGLDLTHVFFCTWQRKAPEAENIKVNGALLENLLRSLRGTRKLMHFALVTGTRRPFIFPGSPFHWNAAADVTDARHSPVTWNGLPLSQRLITRPSMSSMVTSSGGAGCGPGLAIILA